MFFFKAFIIRKTASCVCGCVLHEWHRPVPPSEPVRVCVCRQGPGVKQGLELCMQHAQKALDVLADFERSDAREALENIIHAIMECD